jgi:hypothetical protein
MDGRRAGEQALHGRHGVGNRTASHPSSR